MKTRGFFILVACAGLASATLPPEALASATYTCNNGNCSASGGNGDNGTGNGNSSGQNTVSVGAGTGGTSTGGTATQASGPSSTRYGLSVPIQLPAIAGAGCGSRPTVYAGLTGSPGFSSGFGSGGVGFGFGLGLFSPIGKEPDSCRPATPTASVTNLSVNVPTQQSPVMVQTLPAAVVVPVAIVAPAAAAPASCVPLDADVAAYYAHDLRTSKQTGDTARIDRDVRALDQGCYHLNVLDAIAGR